MSTLDKFLDIVIVLLREGKTIPAEPISMSEFEAEKFDDLKKELEKFEEQLETASGPGIPELDGPRF
jgi:hypothetical protein